jgi:hypothetical protein
MLVNFKFFPNIFEKKQCKIEFKPFQGNIESSKCLFAKLKVIKHFKIETATFHSKSSFILPLMSTPEKPTFLRKNLKTQIKFK